jgi:hypothetical protein
LRWKERVQMTKDEYVIALAEVGVELSSANRTHYEALAQAIGYADSLDRIRSEVAAYPAPSIPKREVLRIIREVIG